MDGLKPIPTSHLYYKLAFRSLKAPAPSGLSFSSGAKAQLHFVAFAARLKSCPDTRSKCRSFDPPSPSTSSGSGSLRMTTVFFTLRMTAAKGVPGIFVPALRDGVDGGIASPGFRCASPWAIFTFSLRENGRPASEAVGAGE